MTAGDDAPAETQRPAVAAARPVLVTNSPITPATALILFPQPGSLPAAWAGRCPRAGWIPADVAALLAAARPGTLLPGLDPGRRYRATNVTPGRLPPRRAALAGHLIPPVEVAGRALARIGLAIPAQRALDRPSRAGRGAGSQRIRATVSSSRPTRAVIVRSILGLCAAP